MHLRGLLPQVIYIVLNNAKTVDPQVSYAEDTCYFHRVLECLRKICPFNSVHALANGIRTCFEKLRRSPAMAKAYVICFFILSLIKPDTAILWCRLNQAHGWEGDSSLPDDNHRVLFGIR